MGPEVGGVDRPPPSTTGSTGSSQFYMYPQPRWTTDVVQHHLYVIKSDIDDLYICNLLDQNATILQEVVHILLWSSMNRCLLHP